MLPGLRCGELLSPPFSQEQIDSLYEATFSGVCLPVKEGKGAEAQCFGPVDEKLWGDLGRSEPLVLKELIGEHPAPCWRAESVL